MNEKDWLGNYLKQALEEDIGGGDYTSLAIFSASAQTSIACVAKESGIIAGIEVANFLYTQLYTSVLFQPLKKDGEKIEKGDKIFQVSGSTLILLSTERVLLNIMQRMSGIATLTYTIVQNIAHTQCRVLDTRKTTPLNRFIEKWAVRIGGGSNHRMGLYDAIMLKDNHIDAAGGISRALERVYNFLDQKRLQLPVIVEARNLAEVKEILDFPIHIVSRILLDNMPPTLVKEAVNLIDKKIPTEASGNINPYNAREYAETGVDFISLGMLTHSVKSLDLSFTTI